MGKQLELPVHNSELVSHKHSLLFWRKRIEADDQYRTLLKGAAFQRLYDISFLGALDYILPGAQHCTGSRADHSLNVAALACYIATARGYSVELRKHLVIAGLLHDIGHPPLSHSAESSIADKLGYGHHVGGERLIKGRVNIGRELNQWLSREIDIHFLLKLLNKEAPANDGGDLFSSPTNIDTIEGITRAYGFLARTPTDELAVIRSNIAQASFLHDDSDTWSALDRFWHLKHWVYRSLITAPKGLAADQISQQYFSDSAVPGLSEHDFFTTENAWKKKHPELFQSLKRFKHTGSIPSWLKRTPVRYTARRYSIDPSTDSFKRYQCQKFEDFAVLSSARAVKKNMEQLGLTH